MRDASLLQGVGEGAHDVALAHDFVELPRSPLAGDDLIFGPFHEICRLPFGTKLLNGKRNERRVVLRHLQNTA